MKKFPLIILITFSVLSLSQYSCHSLTGPKQNSNPPPDTTSNSFTWKEYTFGGNSGSSYFKDVAIVNDTLIYAVGAVYLTDSAGQPDPQPYNLAVWNGSVWKLSKVPYYYQSQPYYHPIISVFAFGAEDIWFCGNGVIHWDGYQYNPIPVPTNVWGAYQMNKMWGTNNKNFFIVGDSGNIAHYTNGTWTKMESGTTTNIADIWGVVNSQNNTNTIFCAVSNKAEPGDEKILRINDNNTVDSISWNTGREVRSIWFDNINQIFACDDGVFIIGGKGTWNEQTILPKYYSNRIRGNGNNDVIVCGDFGLLAHFNGVRWIVYRIPEITSVSLTSVDFKGNTAAVTGEDGTKAYLVIGRR